MALSLLIAPVAAAGFTSGAANGTTLRDDVEPADTVYVKGNGDAVLAYNESRHGDGTTRYGVDMATGLVHMLATGETEENVTADASFVVTPDEFAGNGSLVAPSPESVRRFSFEATGEQNARTASADVTLDAELDGSDTGMGTSGTASTEGSVTVTADTFEASGHATLDAGYSTADESSQRFELRETADGYVLEGERVDSLRYYERDYWNTRENAKAHLERAYGAIAERQGGSAEVTIDRYDYVESDEEATLDVAYTVEYAGLEDAVAESLADAVRNSGSVSLSDEEIDALAEDLKGLTIETVGFETVRSGSETRVRWNAVIENYDEAVFAGLELAENVDGDEFGPNAEDVERAKTTFEAQQAANLEQTVEWTGEMSSGSSDATVVTAELRYRTKNWEAYVNELESRDVDVGRSSFEFSAESENGEVVAEASVEMNQKDMLSTMTESVITSLDPKRDEDALKLLRAFEESGFRTARLDVNVESGTVTVEGGAKFDDIGAFRNSLSKTYGDLNVAGIAARGEDDETTTYVTVEGLVDEDATEEDVRALAIADGETEVLMPGEWDREFPSMDDEAVSSYLGVEGGSESETDGQPGFGALVALAALAGVALLARRD